MTETAKKLVEEFERELEELPEEEQEAYVVSYLQDLRRRKRKEESGQPDQEGEALYEPFQIMVDANLDLPSDDSETYEERLYGAQNHDD